APARGEHSRTENHGATRRRQPCRRDDRVARGRCALGHHRCDPGDSDRRDHLGDHRGLRVQALRRRVNTPSRHREIVRVAALYAAITSVSTWPLVRGLAHDLPGDYGDPLLSVWILAWDATHFGRGWWNANIFY